MAVRVPIISDFDDKGIRHAKSEFASLETVGQKAQYGIQKAAVPAALALGGLAVAAGAAYKAFAQDSAAATKLATTLQNVTQASDAQIESVEKFISATSKAVAVADDELRPALDALVRGTGDVTKAQDLLSLALDISAGTGKDLAAVSDALSKAFNGNLGPLKKLDPALAALIKSGASTDEVFAALATTFKDQASKQADTAEGKMKGLSIQMDELKESVGEAAAPLIEKLIPGLVGVADWASQNTGTVVGIGAALLGIAAATMIANSALAAWNVVALITKGINLALGASFTALWVATGIGIIIAIIAAIVLLNEKFHFMDNVVAAVKLAFEEFWAVVSVIWDMFYEKISGVVAFYQSAWTVVIDVVSKAFEGLWGVISKIITQFIDKWKSAIAIVKNFFKSFAQDVANIFVNMVNAIIRFINALISAYNKLPLANIDPIGLLSKVNLFEVEYGEREDTSELMNRATLNQLTVNVAGSVTTEQDLVESIRRLLINSQRDGNQLVYTI